MMKQKKIIIFSIISFAIGLAFSYLFKILDNELQTTYTFTLFAKNDGLFWINFLDYYIPFPYICTTIGLLLAMFTKEKFENKFAVYFTEFVAIIVILIIFLTIIAYYGFNLLLFDFLAPHTLSRYVFFIIAAYGLSNFMID